MLFQRITSFFAFFLTLGIFVLARPVPGLQAGRDAMSVVTSLRSKTDALSPQIKNLNASSNATNASLEAFLEMLEDAPLNTAGMLDSVDSVDSLSSVPLARSLPVVGSLPSVPSVGSLSTRSLPVVGSVGTNQATHSSNALVSESVAALIEEIVDALDGLGGDTDVLSDIDVALANFLTDLDVILVGVVTLVSGLLTSLVPSLEVLNFISTLSTLNL